MSEGVFALLLAARMEQPLNRRKNFPDRIQSRHALPAVEFLAASLALNYASQIGDPDVSCARCSLRGVRCQQPFPIWIHRRPRILPRIVPTDRK